MHSLVDGYWYQLPDGFLVRARRVGYSNSWRLEAADGTAIYKVTAGQFRQIIYSHRKATYVETLCDLTLEDLQPLSSRD
jgi:hypothetical protein